MNRHLLFHSWETIFPPTGERDPYVTPYKKCRVCGIERGIGYSPRWGIGLDGNWFYDEAMYE